MEYYWELVYRDPKDFKQVRTVQIPPASVPSVRKHWDNGEPVHLNTGSIGANQIISFEKTNKPFGNQKLLDEVAQAFNEPQYNQDGTIIVRWVRKEVTQDQWNRHFSPIGAYKYLGEGSGMTTIAFRLPVHSIDTTKVQYCTEAEVTALERK